MDHDALLMASSLDAFVGDRNPLKLAMAQIKTNFDALLHIRENIQATRNTLDIAVQRYHNMETLLLHESPQLRKGVGQRFDKIR